MIEPMGYQEKVASERRRTRARLGVVMAGMIVLALSVGYSKMEQRRVTDGSAIEVQTDELPKADDMAAGFSLADLFDDQMLYRLDDYSGQPIIVNFWASWCAPCLEEMPALQAAYESHREDGLIILGVNQTHMDDLDMARGFATQLALDFPILRDDDGKVSDELYRVLGLPTSVFISREGRVVYIQIGVMTDEQIERYSRQLVLGEHVGQ